MSPYSVGYRHRHIAEMELVLNQAGDYRADYHFTFTPHLLPINRGMSSTMYVSVPQNVSEADIRGLYCTLYAGEPFVHVLPADQLATVRHVASSNRCAISITPAIPRM